MNMRDLVDLLKQESFDSFDVFVDGHPATGIDVDSALQIVDIVTHDEPHFTAPEVDLTAEKMRLSSLLAQIKTSPAFDEYIEDCGKDPQEVRRSLP